uniref:(northern house mosquito) hypothetical protein n=1 Tax=Culex pipiens TaxID=7175 RepID=A0A8D8B710_CULPI
MIISMANFDFYILRRWNISKISHDLGLILLFWRMSWVRRARTAGNPGPVAPLVVFILACLRFPLFIALDYNINVRVFIAFGATRDHADTRSTTHRQTQTPFTLPSPGIGGTMLRNVFEIVFISLSRLHHQRTFPLINLESLTKNSLINRF